MEKLISPQYLTLIFLSYFYGTLSTVINYTIFINRPLKVVEKALLECLVVHKNLNNIIEFEHLKKFRAFYAHIDNNIWSVDVNDVSISITLTNTKRKDPNTALNLTLRYTYIKKKSPRSSLQRFLFKKYIAKETKAKFLQLKNRTEKWL